LRAVAARWSQSAEMAFYAMDILFGASVLALSAEDEICGKRVEEKLVVSTRGSQSRKKSTELVELVVVVQAERGVSGVLKMEQRPTSGSEAPLV
jgi:hypothetical protein